MNVCIISKFPPIQGGISAKTYWMTRGLAEKDVTVHIVTNANCVEQEYRIDDQSLELPLKLNVHFVDPDIPWHIPSSDLYVPRLLDKALEIIADTHIDVIDTNYLIPYGIVGYMLSKITGIPYILRHGGSDIAKFLEPGIFRRLLSEVIRNASAIITDDKNKKFFEAINPNIHVLPRYIPDEKHFKPTIASRKIPTFACIGKINYYWKYKGLDKIIDIFSGIPNQYALRFVGQGKGFIEFEKFVNDHNMKPPEFKKFIHPAHMPSLLDDIDYLLYFQKDNPIKDFSNIVCEALWSGVTVITDETADMHEYAQYTRGISENQIIRLKLEDVDAAQSQIAMLINQWQGQSRCNLEIDYTYDRYIDETLSVYESMLDS